MKRWLCTAPTHKQAALVPDEGRERAAAAEGPQNPHIALDMHGPHARAGADHTQGAGSPAPLSGRSCHHSVPSGASDQQQESAARSNSSSSSECSDVSETLRQLGQFDNKRPGGSHMNLPFSPMTLTFQDVHYFIPCSGVRVLPPATMVSMSHATCTTPAHHGGRCH